MLLLLQHPGICHYLSVPGTGNCIHAVVVPVHKCSGTNSHEVTLGVPIAVCPGLLILTLWCACLALCQKPTKHSFFTVCCTTGFAPQKLLLMPFHSSLTCVRCFACPRFILFSLPLSWVLEYLYNGHLVTMSKGKN